MSSNWAKLQAKQQAIAAIEMRLGGGGGGGGPGSSGGGGGGGGSGGGGGGKGGSGGKGGGKGGSLGGDRSLSASGPQPGPHKKPRLSVPAPRFEAGGSALPPLLEPGHAEYEACLRRCYRGFVHEPAPLPGALQQRVQAALVRLNAEGYFHHDVVLGSTKGGTAPVPTIVRRILVGEPGITYKVSPNPNPNQLSLTLVRASPNPNPNPSR